MASKTKQKLSKSFYAGLKAQNLKKTVISSSSTFSKSQANKVKSQAPIFRQPSLFRTFNNEIFELYEWMLKNRKERQIKYLLKKDPFVKWQVRKIKLKSGYAIYKRNADEEEEPPEPPEDMVRNVWGSYFACESKGIESGSFTFITFSENDLQGYDRTLCEQKFKDLLTKYLKSLYPDSHYTYENDYWGSTIDVREEKNQSVPYDKNDFGKWIFEFQAEEKDRGNLDEIL